MTETITKRVRYETMCTSCGRSNGIYFRKPNFRTCRYCHTPNIRIEEKEILPPERRDRYRFANPSEVKEVYWISARRQKGNYPKPVNSVASKEVVTHWKSGKWLVFVPNRDIDEVWSKIRKATEEGRLGDFSKVATAKPNQYASSQDRKVICVYTYDWTDYEDVMRIRDELRTLGITSKIPYKSDEDTMDDKYSVKGDKSISKYYW